ncbi:hypothetical protein RB595_008343 [Gaeumannomyces hyphopodioides]
MPPRLPLWQAARCCRVPISSAPAVPAPISKAVVPQLPPTSLASVFGALSLQTRHASILADLRDNEGAYNKRKRVGRGPSSGFGKTSGRGQKGRKARGNVRPWFQGGQTPLMVTWGRKGFVNHRAPELTELNLDRLQEWIDAGRIDATKQITPRELIRSGLVGKVEDGIKILARGAETFRTPVDIVASRVSGAAVAAIEGAGGKVTTRYYTRDSIQRLLRDQAVHTLQPLPTGPEHVDRVLAERKDLPTSIVRMPDPTSRRDIEYYRDPAHRGYLSHTLAPGESPSLYFKVPLERRVVSKAKLQRDKAKNMADPKLW